MDSQIPDDWSATEAGNTWFSDQGRHAIWIVLPDGRRVEIFVDPNKRPGLKVRVLSLEDSADENLSAYLDSHMNGWRHHASNLKSDPPPQIFDSLL